MSVSTFTLTCVQWGLVGCRQYTGNIEIPPLPVSPSFEIFIFSVLFFLAFFIGSYVASNS